jgi:valyl-tRNA synthetase
MSEHSKSYDPSLVEPKWLFFWSEKGVFKADNKSKKPAYSIILPPPNVTGALHMGHALGDTLQDILSRYHRMKGYEVLWLPGLDHAGISTQTIVEKHLMQKEGKRRTEYSREEFLSHVWVWKEKHGDVIVSQMKRLGCSLDFSREAFTMDEKSSLAVRHAFKTLFDKGLIYQGDYLVNWDPITETALADDEVEYEEKEGSLWHIRYPVEGGYIEVATTRPETMLGDTAVAVNPKDERYSHLIGKYATLPITGRTIPIIADDFVDPTFGTGAVKITPAHDFNDYETGKRHNLPMINIMTPSGKIQSEHFSGMTMQEARVAVVGKLKELGFLVKVSPHIHRVGHSYRSKAVIEPYLSKQWFLKMSAFKKDLREMVESGRMDLIPAQFHKTYFHWIDNLRDWCISRQLWWGHRIPIWYHKSDPTQILCTTEEPENAEMWRQDEDVLDTWFSSALWPFSTLGWPEKTADFAKFFPTSILVTGHDILFFWVARMMLMSHILIDEVPFHKAFVHGLIYGKSYWRVDSEGKVHYVSKEERISYELGEPLKAGVMSKWEKMSKSKGNVIDPLEIIEAYGADALRMALCTSVTDSTQIDLDRRRFEEYKNFSNKMWNAARFVLMHLEGLSLEPLDRSLLTVDDRWILRELNLVAQNVNERLECLDFDDAAHMIYSFFWDQFCAYYLETSKPYLAASYKNLEIKANKQRILLIVLLSSIRLLHPITPFITEEIFAKIKELCNLNNLSSTDPYIEDVIAALKSPCCALAPYPKMLVKADVTDKAKEDFAVLSSIVYAIRNVRSEMQIGPGEMVEIYLISDATSLLKEGELFIKSLARASSITLSSNEPSGLTHFATGMAGSIKIIIPLPIHLLEKEKERLRKESLKLKEQIAGLISKLQNAQFIERAPKALVDQTKENLSSFELKLREIEAKL